MNEEHSLKPLSPYASAKAGADRLVYSYWATYQLPAVIVRPFNNFGPRQHLEKAVPRFITSCLLDEPLGERRIALHEIDRSDCCGSSCRRVTGTEKEGPRSLDKPIDERARAGNSNAGSPHRRWMFLGPMPYFMLTSLKRRRIASA